MIPGLSIQISTEQITFLIRHANLGLVPIIKHGGHEGQIRTGLLMRDLIKYDNPISPTHTKLTLYGREVTCCILGWMADRLIEAAIIKEKPKVEVKKIRAIGLQKEHHGAI